MDFTSEQLNKLRIPLEEAGVFSGRTEAEIQTLLRDIATLYVTLADINVRIKRNKHENNER